MNNRKYGLRAAVRVCAVLLCLGLALSASACGTAANTLPPAVSAGDSEPMAAASPSDTPEEPVVQETPAEEPVSLSDVLSDSDAVSAADAPQLPASAEEIFADAVFVGDSVTLGLRNHSMKYKTLNGAQFACAGSYSVKCAVDGTMLLFFNGAECSTEEAIKSSGAGYVFVLLGLNDINKHGVEEYIRYWDEFIGRIKAMNPDVEIFIEACTPAYRGGNNKTLDNRSIDERNAAMAQYCEENGVHFIDTATPLKNEIGTLKDEYSSDKYVHLSYDGYTLLIDTLTQYLETEYLGSGVETNETEEGE